MYLIKLNQGNWAMHLKVLSSLQNRKETKLEENVQYFHKQIKNNMSFVQPLSTCIVHCELKNPDSKESAIFWLFLVELFMRYSLRSQLSSSRYFIRILKLNSAQTLDVTNIYLKREKSP